MKTIHGTVLAGVGLTLSSAAVAQPMEQIVVTARKQQETLLEVPLAVTALSAADIESRQISTLINATQYTPSFSIATNSVQRNDRSSQTLLVRGIVPIAGNQTTSVFIDGAPVAGAGFVAGLEDLERVEVLKGPQSAYFGRSVFAGAVNLVTRNPGSTFKGSAQASYGEHQSTDNRLSIEGPLAGDKLTFRISGRYYSRHGDFRNNAPEGERLGDETTASLSGILYATPSDTVTAKLFVVGFRDKDGATSVSKYSQLYFNCRVGSATTNNYFCGTIKTLPESTLAINLPQRAIDLLVSNASGLFDPYFKIFNHDPGLERRAWQGHLGVDVELPANLTFSSITAIHQSRQVTLLNSTVENMAVNVPNPVFNATGPFPYPAFLQVLQNKVRDFSQEIRLSTDQDKPLRAFIGFSWLRAEAGTYAFGNGPQAPTVFQQVTPLRTNTKGLFGSIAYDFTPEITLTAEGRYQMDKPTLYTRTRAVLAQAEYNNFIPRATLQYKFSDDNQVYLNYAKGVNPGTFNTSLPTQSAAAQQIARDRYGAGLVVRPEKLSSYEIGYKGRLLDDRAQVTLAAYIARWRDQIATDQFLAPSAVNPAVTTVVRVLTNTGATNLWGFEAEGSFRVLPELTLTGAFGYNKSTLKAYPNVPFAAGLPTNVVGTELNNVPKFNGAVGAAWQQELGGTDFDWYARADYIFAAGLWDTVFNLAKSEAKNRVDARVGVMNDRFTIEAYALNLFNDKAPTSVSQVTDLSRTTSATPYAINVGLPRLREIGGRVRYNF
jgi:iron complex outermembrane receptor protein